MEESDMNHYLLSVHMVEGEGYGSEEEMQQAFKDVDPGTQCPNLK